MSLAYSKEENGRIERANKEILRHLRAFVSHSKVVDDWKTKLPLVQRIMNASVHSVTGYSPATLLFGNAVNLNQNILPCNASSPTIASEDLNSQFYTEWLDLRNKAQQEVLLASAEVQEALKAEHLVSIETKDITVFDVGQLVLVQPHDNPLSGRRPKDKLSTYWSGPYEVVS